MYFISSGGAVPSLVRSSRGMSTRAERAAARSGLNLTELQEDTDKKGVHQRRTWVTVIEQVQKYREWCF